MKRRGNWELVGEKLTGIDDERRVVGLGAGFGDGCVVGGGCVESGLNWGGGGGGGRGGGWGGGGGGAVDIKWC